MKKYWITYYMKVKLSNFLKAQKECCPYIKIIRISSRQILHNSA